MRFFFPNLQECDGVESEILAQEVGMYKAERDRFLAVDMIVIVALLKESNYIHLQPHLNVSDVFLGALLWNNQLVPAGRL